MGNRDRPRREPKKPKQPKKPGAERARAWTASPLLLSAVRRHLFGARRHHARRWDEQRRLAQVRQVPALSGEQPTRRALRAQLRKAAPL